MHWVRTHSIDDSETIFNQTICKSLKRKLLAVEYLIYKIRLVIYRMRTAQKSITVNLQITVIKFLLPRSPSMVIAPPLQKNF